MVAVIAGNGLGLLGTSLQQLGLSPGGQSSLGQSGASQYVNIATGNLVLQSQDERLVERGLLAGLVRTYNSLGTTGDVGNAGGWLLGLDRKLSPVTGTVNTDGSILTRDGGDGEEEVFTYDSTRELYVASNESGAADTLQQNADGTWTYTAGGTRNEETYSSAGQLTTLLDASTGASYTLHYGGWFVQRLTAITSTDGEALEIGYDAQGRVNSLSTYETPPGGGSPVTLSRVAYGYDDSGRLISVSTQLDPSSPSSTFSTRYTYDGSSTRIASLVQDDGLTVSYTYAQDGQGNYRIASVQTGEGNSAQKLNFTYDTADGITTVADASDPSRAWVYTYDPNGNLTSITSPLSQVTCYVYTTDGHLASVTDALNNQTVYEYDAHGNRTLERDADGNTITWTYNDDDQVLTRTVYQVPDPDGTGPSPASVPSTTWYVYDDGTTDAFGKKDQLRYVIDADGNVSETQYNANGQVSLTRSFAGAAYDTSSLTDSTCPTLSQMETWKSRQDLTQTTRVDYSYDLAGRLSQKIAWDMVKPDGSGQGDNGESITTYVYDAQGLLRQQITARGSNPSDTTSYSYDGLGRLIGSTDAMGGVTTYAYSGDVASGTGTLTITQSVSNGVNRVRTEVRNSAGELVTVTESASDGSAASRTTHYIYDPAGQLRAVQDPSGAISYTFYDEAGRISGTVDAMGGVTQYVRDADGNVVETRQYANAVDTTTWLSNGAVTPTDIAAIAPAASPDDRTTLSLYDNAGQRVADVNALGDVTTYAYDGAGNLTTTTQYATALTATQLSALQDAPSWSTLQTDLSGIASANDRINRTFYDIANRAVATLDAAGYVTTTAYDAAGRVIRTTAFATALDLATVGNPPSLSDVVKVAHSDDDQTTRYFYDNRGQLIAKLDADGYLTTTAYDETANTTTTTRYANQLTGLTGSETLADLSADVTGSAFQTSINQYDADGRLSIATAVDGTVTSYAYDQAGNLLSSTATPTSGSQDARETEASYDAFGDALSTTDGTGKTSTYMYNVLGQKVLSTDALGNNTWFFYDADGRLVYTVRGLASNGTQNALGEVSAITYNALGQATGTTRYAGWLDLNALGLSATSTVTLSALQTAVEAIAGKGPNPDATSSYTYTLNGLTASIRDGLGYITTNSYDAFDDLIQTQQQLSAPGQELAPGNSVTTTYSYDARGERTGEVDDAGGLNRTTGVIYDAFGRVTSRTDGNGHITTYSYDALGRQISVSETVEGAVRTASTTYDAYGRVLTTTDALGQVTSYAYSADTHAVTVTTPAHVTSTTTRDAYGERVLVADSLNNTTHYSYDGDGRLLTETDALGHVVVSNVYDDAGNLTSSTDANGVVTAYTYDAAGRMATRTVDAGDSTHLNLTTFYAYDGRGQQVSVTDANGVLTTYSYDADGNVLTVVKDAGTGNLNLSTTYTWDGAGHQLSVTEGAGTAAARTTQYTYDNLGRRVTTQVDPAGLDLTTRYIYDTNNNLVAKTDADGNVTRYVYDEANELIYTLSPSGPTTAQLATVTQNGYDADGHRTSARVYDTAVDTSALGLAPSGADIAGLVTADSANDQVSYTAYTEDGQVAYTIDAQGYVTEVRHDADGRVSETLAYAHAITLDATLQSELQQGTAVVNGAQAPVYTVLASAVSAAGNTDQNAQATLNLYDDDGQMRFVVRQNTVNGQLLGTVAEKQYDAAGRVVAEIAYGTPLVLNTTESLADQLSADSVAQSVSSMTDLHLTSYVYDGAGRLRYTIDAGSYVTEQDYDRVGNVTDSYGYLNKITIPATLTVTSVAAAVSATNTTESTRHTNNTYDHAGRLKVIAKTVSDTLTLTQQFEYDATGLKTSYTDRNLFTWNYVYDKAGRLTEQDTPPVAASTYTTGNTLATATAAIETGFTYDGNGNVLTRTEGYGTAVARTISYGYDRAGNQVKITYPSATYINSAGQTVTGATASSVTYNALGQAVVNQDVSGHYEYKAYDQDGRVAYEVDGNGYVTAYSYDAYGNQTQVTRYATALNTSAITGWSAGHALSMAQVQEGLVAGGSDRTLTTTYDLLGEKTQVQQSEITFAYAFDTEGGVTATASPTTTYSYDAYGNLISTQILVQPSYGTVGQSGYTAPVWATTYDYYDTLDRKTLEVDPAGYVTTWAYDAAGDVTSTVQYAKAIATSGLSTATPPALPPAGDAASGFDRIFHYGYDRIGRKTNEIDYGGYSSDVSNAQSIAQGQVDKVFTYDGEGRVTSAMVNGATTTTTYDALGRVLSVLEPGRPVLLSNWQALLEANPNEDLSWSSLYETGSPLTLITYDALGNALSTKRYIGSSAAGGSQITYDHHDALGRVVSETDADGTTYTNAYDAAGNLRTTSYTLTGNSGSSTVTTTYTYDADNQRLSEVTQRSGASTADSAQHVKYNAFGEIVAKGDGVINAYSSTGYELTYGYDNVGNLITANDPKTGAAHEYSYDLKGDLIGDFSNVAGGSSVWKHYWPDIDGRSRTITLPSYTSATGEGSGPIQYTYDRWGNVLSTTDARGYVTTYEYDSQNHLIKETEPDVMVVATNGIRTWQTPTKAWYYDVNGHLTGVTDENGHTTTNTYDAAGELTATTDAVGAITRYAYDGLGRQVAKQTPITSTSWHITWQDLDALGRVVQEGDFLLSGSTLVKSIQQKYALDQNGNRIKVTDALTETSYYSYDSQGHLLSSQTPLQHAAGEFHTYAYDVNGNKTKETDATGVSQSWSYDYYGRVRSHTDLSGASYTYTYDASSGLLTQQSSSWNPAQSDPSYVPSSDHSGSSTESYTYYADGQVQQITQKVGSLTTGTTTYKYDADGNETDQDTQTVDGAGTVVDTDTQSVYDSHNRLSEVTQLNTSTGAGIERTVYNYDAAGNRRAVFVQSGYDGTAINTGTIGGPTASASSTTVQPGASLNFNAALNFSDKLGFGLTYTATGLPSWMHISTTGVLSGTAPKPAGSWTVVVTATDALGKSVSANVTVTVPVVNPVFSGTPPTLTWQTGTLHSYTGPAATDANGSPISYQATYNNGSAWTSTLPSWLTFNASTRTFSGTPPTGSAGTYTLALNAYPADGGHAAWIFTVNVTQTPTPPAYNGGIGEIQFNAGQSNSWSVPKAAFTTSDGGGLSYSIKKSDGTALPTVYTFNATTGTLTATLGNQLNDHSIPVIITATDTKNGLSTSISTDIYITGSGGGMQVVRAGTMSSTGSTMQTTTDSATMQATTQATTAPNIQSYWFTYDNDNRVDISGGDLVNGQIQLTYRSGQTEQGSEQLYNLAGNVVTELSNDGVDVKTQTFGYDARGELIRHELPFDAQKAAPTETRQYDADGRLVADVYYLPSDTPPEQYSNPDGVFYLPIADWMSEATLYYYDHDGRVTNTVNYGRPYAPDWNQIAKQLDAGTITVAEEMDPPTSLPAAGASQYGLLDRHSQVTYTSYDAEGNAKSYQSQSMNLQSGVWTTTNYAVDYIKKDGYLEQTTTGTSAGLVTTVDTSDYDAFGRRVDIITHSDNSQIPDSVRAFAYDADGQILERRDGTVSNNGSGTFTADTSGYGTQHYTYVNDQQIGNVDQAGEIDVLSGLTAFSNSDSGTQSYVVQAGDTLQSIAQTIYGDANLWYVVADANSLAADGSDLAAGQRLKLPQVETNSNTSSTFKPYNPNEISGSTTPSLPQAPQPPPSVQHCSTLAMIVVIAVVVVVSIFTAGAAAEAFAGTLGTTAGGGFTGIMAAGGAALTGGTVVGATGVALGAGELMGAAAIGGAVGDAAGQLVGDAEGIHQGFSWGEMLGAGLGAGITAGLGHIISGGASVTKLAGEHSLVADAKIAGIGASSAIGNYAGEKLAGQPAHFSWANVAAAAISTEITAQMHLPTNTQLTAGESSGHFLEDFSGSLVNGAIDSETARLLGGDAQNGRQIVEDAFGNALGNAAIGEIEQQNAATEEAQARANLKPATIESQPIQVNDLVPQRMTVDTTLADGTYTVQSGDSISKILGTSDPGAIGAFMRSNGLTSSMIYPGEQVVIPSGGSAQGDAALGQATLNADNQRIAALQASQSSNGYAANIQFVSPGEREEEVVDVASSFQRTNPWSLATMGTGVGEVDKFGQPLHGPSHFSLLGTFSNVIHADEPLSSKLGQVWDLLNYEVPDAEQRIAAREGAQRAAEAPFARTDLLANNSFAAVSYGIAYLSGASDQTADAIAQTTAVATPFLFAGAGGYTLSLQNEEGVPNASGAGDLGIQLIGGRAPINSRYAGQTYPLENLPLALQVNYPNSVNFTLQGFPDFSPYSVAEVQLSGLTGNYANDAALANEAVGLDATPQGYVWHHVEDGETMQLIPQDLHNAVRHTGGAAVIRYGQ